MLGEPCTAQVQALPGLHCVAAPFGAAPGEGCFMGLQVKEKAIDKGKWSGRARPRTSPAQVCPVCLPLRLQLLHSQRSSRSLGPADRSTGSLGAGQWVVTAASDGQLHIWHLMAGGMWASQVPQQCNLSAGEGRGAGTRS